MSNLAIIDHYYEQLLHCDKQKKQAFLDELYRKQPDIHLQLMQLLYDDEIDDFFNNIEKEVSNSFQGKLYGPGSEIGNYRLEEVIGTGGMSFVYRASRTDGLFQRDSAVKIVRKGFDSAKITQHFMRECQIAAQLHHENIARIYDGGITTDGLPFLVMEYVDGVNIVEHCQRYNLDVFQKIELFRQLCNAVNYCHQNEIIHCDLKPGNVLVNKQGQVKLTDFGIAKTGYQYSVFNSRDYGLRALTLEYASPELKAGGEVEETSDIFQLGLILYELLTFKQAFKSQPKDLEIAADYEHIDRILSQVVKICTRRKTSQRFPDVFLLLKALEQALDLIIKKQNNTSVKNFFPEKMKVFLKHAVTAFF